MRRLMHLEPAGVVFSALFTLCAVAGAYFDIGYRGLGLSTVELASWVTPPILLCFCVGAIILFLAALVTFNAISCKLDELTSAEARGAGPLAFRVTLHRWFWRLFLLLVICWLPWIIAHLPGAIDEDTIWQLTTWRLPQTWSDHNPWLTTVLFGTFLDFGRTLGNQGVGLALYGAIQALLTAASFSVALCYLKRFRVPRPLFVTCTVMLCALPCFASYGSEMVKDALFAWPWLLFAAGYIECVRTRGACLRHAPVLVGMIVLGILIVLTRKTGIYLILPACLVLFFVIGAPSRGRLALLCLVPLVFLMIWSHVLLPAWGVGGTSSGEYLSVPLQQTARFVTLQGDTLSEEDRAVIDKVVSYEAMATEYNQYFTDAVKDTYKDPDREDLNAYLHLWMRIGMQHPGIYLAATFDTAIGYLAPWYPMSTKNEIDGKFLDDYGSYFAQFYVSGGQGTDRGADPIVQQVARTNTDGLGSCGQLAPFRHLMNGYEKVVEYSPLRVLDSMALLVLWLPLFMFCYGLRRGRHDRSIVCCLMPSLMLFLTLLASPVAFVRYALPGIYTFALIVALPFVMPDSAREETAGSNREERGR